MLSLHRLARILPRSSAGRPAASPAVAFFLAVALAAPAFLAGSSLPGPMAPQGTQGISPELRAEFERWWEAQPRTSLPVLAEGAKVVIVKFTDLQCPSCGVSHFAMKAALAGYESRFPGAVKLLTKDYPLQAECNPSIRSAFHLAACDAAAAVRMARQNGKGDVLEDFFYKNQASLTPASVRQAAAALGGVTDFEARRPGAISAIRTDVGLGRLLGVNATPTFYVNGVKCEAQGQPLATPFILAAVEYELRKAGLK